MKTGTNVNWEEKKSLRVLPEDRVKGLGVGRQNPRSLWKFPDGSPGEGAHVL